MHYYKFNISDWNSATSHLSLVEEAIYFRLINYYYDKQESIPLDTQSVYRRLRIGNDSVIADLILAEFFVKTDAGWTHSKCDELISQYKLTEEKNKKNGKLGGRKPINDKKIEENTQNKPSGLSVGLQEEPKHNPNQELLTNNHKPITINQEPNKKHTASSDAIRVADYLAQRILIKSPDAKIKPHSWLKDIDLAIRIDNRTANDLITIIDWIYTPAGAFWIPNIMSGQKLRQKYDTMKLQAGAFATKKPAPDNFQSKNYGENRDI